jgi:diadenylate cyclase
MDQLLALSKKYLSSLYIPSFGFADAAEIIIISFLVYHLMVWIKNTRAWALLKGIVFIMIFILVAALFQMNTILWIAENVISLAVIAFVVVLQPELRKALEQLGNKNIFSSLFPFESGKTNIGRFTDKTISEIIKATYEMGKVKTGALIVVEQNISLSEYERTGITVDALISSQLMINIFEHNTPLHDGAVIIRGDRIVSATCYLPLSDNRELSKDLGTRHRAAVGISEATDAFTIIVSEESGIVSYSYKGEIYRNVMADEMRNQLLIIQNKQVDDRKVKLKRGRTSK